MKKPDSQVLRQLANECLDSISGDCEIFASQRPDLITSLVRQWITYDEDLTELIARINLDQEFDFRDRNGLRQRLWHDPTTLRFGIQAIDLAPPPIPARMPPLFCPKCSAILDPWQDGKQQQTCPNCGQVISLD